MADAWDPVAELRRSMRWDDARRFVSVALVVAVWVGFPWALLADRAGQRELRRVGVTITVVVEKVHKEIRGRGGECRRVQFSVGDREHRRCSDRHQQGERVQVISDGRRAILADETEDSDLEILGVTAFFGSLALAAFGWFGLGAGLAPITARVGRGRARAVPVLVIPESVEAVTAPQGRVYDLWRARGRTHFVELTVVTESGERLGWTGAVVGRWERRPDGEMRFRIDANEESLLVGDVRPGGWAWLRSGRRKRRFCPPAAKLIPLDRTFDRAPPS